MIHSTLLFLLAIPTASLVTRPRTGCNKVSLLHRGDPADSKTIEGDDCGNVKQIVGKWAKAKKVGSAAGAAKAAVTTAELAAKNSAAAAEQAKKLGEKVGLKGKAPEGVKLAAESAEKASKAAETASSKLSTSADTFSGKTADFAKAITDADIA